MAKLYFRYGTVHSAKTLNLLAVAHTYERQNKRILILKPATDTRFGVDVVQSRCGLSRKADVVVKSAEDITGMNVSGVSCVLVDEVQFFTPDQIEALRNTAAAVPVICYGLRADFRTVLFPGSQRLLELADAIEEVKTTCARCNRKAIINMRLVNGKKTTEGAQVMIGDTEYVPVCYEHYADK